MRSLVGMGEARNAVHTAMRAIAEAEEENEEDLFESIVQTTRRSFRPSRIVQSHRGRRRHDTIRKKTFLLRRSNSDYFPIKSECDALTSIGLGKYFKDLHINILCFENCSSEAYYACIYPLMFYYLL